MINSRNVKTKRHLVLVSAIAFVGLPPLASLFFLGLPVVGVSKGHEIAFWHTVSSLVLSVVFPVALIVAYLRWPRRLEPAYWILPFYFGLEGVDGLLDVFIRWRVQTNIGGAWVQSLLFSVLAFLLWYYRPRHASSDDVLGSSDEVAAQPR